MAAVGIRKLSHSQVTSGATPPAVSALPRDFVALARGPCQYEELKRLLSLRWARCVNVMRWSTETRKTSSSAHRQSILQCSPPQYLFRRTDTWTMAPRFLVALQRVSETTLQSFSHTQTMFCPLQLCHQCGGSCVLRCGIQPDNQSP